MTRLRADLSTAWLTARFQDKCDESLMKSENPVLWSPSVGDVASSNMKAFMQSVAHRLSRAVKTLEDLHAWSIDDSEGFWCAIWEFCGVIGERGSSPYRTHPDTMWQAGWFPAASLNFAENLLRRQDDQEAIVFHGEGSVERRLSFKQLYNEVSRVRAALINCGVKPHDRVAGFMPNIPEAVEELAPLGYPARGYYHEALATVPATDAATMPPVDQDDPEDEDLQEIINLNQERRARATAYAEELGDIEENQGMRG